MKGLCIALLMVSSVAFADVTLEQDGSYADCISNVAMEALHHSGAYSSYDFTNYGGIAAGEGGPYYKTAFFYFWAQSATNVTEFHVVIHASDSQYGWHYGGGLDYLYTSAVNSTAEVYSSAQAAPIGTIDISYCN
jgi:hypothetical protein